MLDTIVIGGGLLGLATAHELSRRGRAGEILVLEKEPRLAAHQSGRNSGVLHSGLYYRPGSLKARLTREGVEEMLAFCEENGVAYELCGKLVVATTEEERPRLEALFERGRANGVPGLERIGPERAAEIEPHVRAVAALYAPRTGIVDFAAVAAALATRVEAAGHRILRGVRVLAGRRDGVGIVVETTAGAFRARRLVACAGLHADRIARAFGLDPPARIVPFRGEYRRLAPDKRSLVRALVYPVPDPELPFLGVHLTRRLDGEVEAGPNAVLALAREGYRWRDVVLADLLEMLAAPGFRKMARRYWRVGLAEIARSVSRRRFARAVRRLVPAIAARDLLPGRSGVRAQAVDADGRLVDDFAFAAAPRMLHVVNAPSPGATAALAIARYLADRLDELD